MLIKKRWFQIALAVVAVLLVANIAWLCWLYQTWNVFDMLYDAVIVNSIDWIMKLPRWMRPLFMV